MRIITIVSEKGGPGKTSSAVNIAAGLAELGKVVVLIDLDPQGNAGMSLGIEPDEEMTTAEVLMKERTLQEIMLPVRENLYFAPASRRLYETQKILVGNRAADRRLKKALNDLTGVDFVIIDNAPGNTILHDNSYMCATEVIIPVETKLFSTKGLIDVRSTIDEVKEDNPALNITGIIITKLDERRNQDLIYCKAIREQFNELVFTAEVPETVRISEAQAAAQTIYEYERWGKAARAYKRICEEIIERGIKNGKN